MRKTRLTNPAVRDCNFKAEPFSFSLKQKEEGSAHRVTSIHLIEKNVVP